MLYWLHFLRTWLGGVISALIFLDASPRLLQQKLSFPWSCTSVNLGNKGKRNHQSGNKSIKHQDWTWINNITWLLTLQASFTGAQGWRYDTSLTISLCCLTRSLKQFFSPFMSSKHSQVFPDCTNTLINIINGHILWLFQPTYSTQPEQKFTSLSKKRPMAFIIVLFQTLNALQFISVSQSPPAVNNWLATSLEKQLLSFSVLLKEGKSIVLREQSSRYYFSTPLSSLWILMWTRDATCGVLYTEVPEQVPSAVVKQEWA